MGTELMSKTRKDNKPTTGNLIAAGGIIHAMISNETRIAVIHRKRYDDEWCLPKGKPLGDETLEQTALREVEEETGCKARITSFAGTVRYLANGTPKEVHFWNMAVDGNCSFRPSDEVVEVLWLTPQEAIRRIKYPEQKEILRKVFEK